MPTLVNYLPFPNFRYYSSDADGKDFGVIIVKGTFEITDDGQLIVAEEQAPIMFEDECHDEINVSSLWHPSDLVPKKPTADIIVNAVARAPGGRPLPSWECGIKVEGAEGTLVEKRLRVTGQRWWVPHWRVALNDEDKRDWQRHRKWFSRWELSEPKPVTEVPLHYELAFGGTWTRGEDKDGNPVWDCDGRNPVGRGWIDADWTDHTRLQPAPQIELAGAPIAGPYDRSVPQTLGPIPPAWEPRLKKGGTYDQYWQDNVWPHWPADYDFAYHQSSHPDLICPRHLVAGDEVTLDHLVEGRERLTVTVPPLQPVAGMVRADSRAARRKMALDTLFLDIGGRRRDARVFLSWRTTFEPGVFQSAVLMEQRDLEALTKAMAKRAA